MKVLVTGGSGQVGSALRASAPADVDLQAPSSRELDIRRSESVGPVVEAFKPDLVINAAAYTQVERAEGEPELAMAVNGAGARNVAAASAASGCPVVHLSTDYVFDGHGKRPYVEDDTTAPLNVYGRTKLAGENAVRECLAAHLILRVSWVFSATGSNFVRTMLGLAHLDEVKVVDDQHGTPCAAASVAAALWRIAGRMAGRPRFGTYHFASAPATTWHGFAQTLFALRREADPAAGTPDVVAIPTSERPTKAERPLNSVLDCSKLRDDFGIQAPDWRSDLRTVVGQLMSG